MASYIFDTLKFADALKAAGVPAAQAEAQARAIAEAFVSSDVATKADLRELRAATKADLLEVKGDMIKWVIGLALAQVALIVGIILRLPH
jgi:hypothetical protein